MMIARKKTFLFLISLVFSLSEHFAESCLSEYSNGSAEEIGKLQKIIDVYDRVIRAGQTVEFSTDVEVKTSYAEAVAVWMVHSVIVRYITIFAKGYLHFKNNGMNEQKIACQGIIFSFLGNLPNDDFFMQFSEKFVNRVQKLQNKNIGSDAFEARQEYLVLTKFIDRIPELYNYLPGDLPPNAFEVFQKVISKRICPYFGNMLYGRSKTRDNEPEKEETYWMKTKQLYDFILKTNVDIEKLNAAHKTAEDAREAANDAGENSDKAAFEAFYDYVEKYGNERIIVNMGVVFRILEMPYDVEPQDLEENESLELTETNKENDDTTELRLVIKSVEGSQFFTGEKVTDGKIIED